MTGSSRRNSGGTGATDEVARLIRLAGARPAPGAALEESVRAAVEHEWRALAVPRKHGRARRLWLAASAGILAIGSGWVALHHAPESPQQFVGTIIATRGAVQVSPLVGRALITSGDALAVGSRIETGPNGAALLSVASLGVRVGPATVLALERPGQLHFVRGQLYVDSGETPQLSTLRVVTEFGSLSHLGTQYQIRVWPGQFLYAAVREGQLRVEAYGQAQTVTSGEGLRVSKDKTVTRLVVPTFDPQWQWVSNFVPEFSIEGRPLSAFLDWFARETGRTLTFVLPATRGDTDRTILRGNISGLMPVQALDAVVATTRYQYDLSVPGQIRVGIRTSGGGVRMNRHAKPNAATSVPFY